MNFKKGLTSTINIMAFTIPMLAVLFQGCYFPAQYISIMCGFLLLIVFYSISYGLLINKNIIILTSFLCILYVLPVFTAKADFLSVILESLRFVCFGLAIILCGDLIKNKMLAGLYCGITAVSALGIFAYLKLINIKDWACEVDGVFRMQSTIGYANSAAVYCGIGVILSYIYRKKSKDLKPLHSVCMFINLVGLILTFSRFGILCFALSVLLFLCFKHRYAVYATVSAVILAVAGAAYLFATEKKGLLLGSSLVSRFIYWQDGFKLWIGHPLGVGAGEWENWQFFVQSSGYNVKFVHNGILQIMLDGGIMSLIACILFLYMGIYGLVKKWLLTKDYLYAGFIACCFLIVSHSFVDIDLSFGATLIILGVLLGFGIDGNCKVKKTPVIIVAVLLIAFSVYIGIANHKRDLSNYDSLIAEITARPYKVSVISRLYNIAYSQNNAEDMYTWSKMWAEAAPRQQSAYDAYLVSLDRMIEQTSNDIYKEEKVQLYKKADEINKIVNPLCKYYDSYTNIVLPKVK